MTPEQKQLLQQCPPATAMRSRRGDDGHSLTYVEGMYIAATMNEIFGPDGWSRQFAGQGLQLVDKDQDDQGRWSASMTCEYRLAICGSMAVSGMSAEDVGVGHGGPCVLLGHAIESAAKEAVTDALKRCARTIGNALGACLYDRAWLKTVALPDDGQGPHGPEERWQDLQDRLNGSQVTPTDEDFPQDVPPDDVPTIKTEPVYIPVTPETPAENPPEVRKRRQARAYRKH